MTSTASVDEIGTVRNPHAQAAARRRMALAVLVALVCAAALFAWMRRPDRDRRAIRAAGSSRYVGPIGALRLVSVMDPPDAVRARAFDERDVVSVPDSRIQVDISDKLEQMNLPVDPLDIHVHQGHVVLAGHVDDPLMRDAIEVAVRSVDGVRSVVNKLQVVGNP